MNAPSVTGAEFAAWKRYIHETCGIFLDDTKGYLIETRLTPLLAETGSTSWAELLAKVKAGGPGKLQRQVIDAITTNETSFFRDTAPFELLRFKLFPELIDRRTKAGLSPLPIRILSAACSNGQEAYSTLFVLKDLLGSFNGYDIRVLGLDIADAMVAKASYAHFSQLEVERGLSPENLPRYFDRAGDSWKVRDEIRASATFRRANLLDPIMAGGRFDLVFCRNVAIYFNEADRIRLFRNLGQVLAPDGVLIIGSTESLTGLCPEYEPKRYQRTVYYQKKSPASPGSV